MLRKTSASSACTYSPLCAHSSSNVGEPSTVSASRSNSARRSSALAAPSTAGLTRRSAQSSTLPASAGRTLRRLPCCRQSFGTLATDTAPPPTAVAALRHATPVAARRPPASAMAVRAGACWHRPEPHRLQCLPPLLARGVFLGRLVVCAGKQTNASAPHRTGALCVSTAVMAACMGR